MNIIIINYLYSMYLHNLMNTMSDILKTNIISIVILFHQCSISKINKAYLIIKSTYKQVPFT